MGANLVNANGSISSDGNNLSNDPAGGDNNTAPGGFLNSGGDIRNSDPNLGPLQNNGGATKTHLLVAPSPAIDTGDNEILAPPLSLTSDQRGPGFPRLLGPRVDRGAVETGANAVVTTLDDHDDGACTTADCTLREAIAAVNGLGTGSISFARDLRGVIQLGSALPNVSSNLVLKGPGANLLTVRRNSGGDYRIFTISNGTIDGPTVSLIGLTIANGRAPVLMSPSNSGGGILIYDGSLFLEACAVIGDSTADDGVGGGICNFQGNLFIEKSSIAGTLPSPAAASRAASVAAAAARFLYPTAQ